MSVSETADEGVESGDVISDAPEPTEDAVPPTALKRKPGAPTFGEALRELGFDA